MPSFGLSGGWQVSPRSDRPKNPFRKETARINRSSVLTAAIATTERVFLRSLYILFLVFFHHPLLFFFFVSTSLRFERYVRLEEAPPPRTHTYARIYIYMYIYAPAFARLRGSDEQSKNRRKKKKRPQDWEKRGARDAGTCTKRETVLYDYGRCLQWGFVYFTMLVKAKCVFVPHAFSIDSIILN